MIYKTTEIRQFGIEAIVTYDSNRHLTDIIYPDLSTTHFDYDSRGNKYYEENQYSARTYTHDDLGRVETVTDEILAKMITYHYDQNGNRAKMVGPDGETTTYRYDALNRIKELTDPDGEKTVFFYDKAGKRESIRFPNGVRGVYLYDGGNRLQSIVYKNTAGDVISSFTYTHDNVGNRQSKTFVSGDSESYGYDDLHRLTTATYPNGRSVSYDYDPVGNRNFLTEAWDGGGSETTTYTYSDFNQVLTTTNSVGTTTYGWDDNGNLATRESPAAELTQYAYNFENRLIGILYPGGAANAFGYDPQGIRTFKDDSQGLHRYLIDQVSVLAEFNGTGAKKAWFNANPQRIDEILSQVQAAGKFYHLVDGLGSVYGLVNQEQVKVASYSYDAYGALTDQQVDPGVANPFLFTGRELDADSGWQYNRARYYLSGVGSWNREDPLNLREFETVADMNMRLFIWFLGACNSQSAEWVASNYSRFQYCSSKPTAFIDPLGNAGVDPGKLQLAIMCAISPFIAAVTFLFLLEAAGLLLLLVPFAIAFPLTGAVLLAIQIAFIAVFVIIIAVFVEFFIEVCLFGGDVRDTSFWDLSVKLGAPIKEFVGAISRLCP